MFKFVHIADVHLDSAILGYDTHRQTILDAVFDSFERSIDLCIENKCHALLISGDLFDSEHMTFNTEIKLRDCFARLARNGIYVLYALGNHDSAMSNISLSKLGESVFAFDNEEPKTCDIVDSQGNKVAIVAGVGYSKRHVKENLAKKFSKIDTDVPVVGMLHTSLDKGSYTDYSPCKMEDLEATGYQYWALGHVHDREIINKANTSIVYPGCISGRHWNETGTKGCVYVEIDGVSAPKIQPVDVSSVTWHQLEVGGLDDAKDAGSIVDICSEAIYHATQNDKTNFIRMTLKGACPIAQDISSEDIESMREHLEQDSGCKLSIKNNLITKLKPSDYKDDKHLLSIAMKYVDLITGGEDSIDDLVDIVKTDYKGFDGGDSREYVMDLLEDIDRLLCESMINMDKVGDKL